MRAAEPLAGGDVTRLGMGTRAAGRVGEGLVLRRGIQTLNDVYL